MRMYDTINGDYQVKCFDCMLRYYNNGDRMPDTYGSNYIILDVQHDINGEILGYMKMMHW